MELKKKMLSWASRFNIFCFLDNQEYSVHPHQYECLLAAGAGRSVSPDNLEALNDLIEAKKAWLFGHLSYGLGNTFLHLPFGKPDRVGFPPFYFFEPEILLLIRADTLVIEAPDPSVVYQDILDQGIEPGPSMLSLNIKQQLSREEYLAKIAGLQRHILRGDCYEVNFCQEFYAENVRIHPPEIFQKLITLSPNPFSSLYRLHDKYLICASPERFLLKKAGRIISQPMKGTIRRNPGDRKEDERLKEELRLSAKDQSENVMVVDMVRNDLSRICQASSVKVDELFGIYSYPQVHQMISSVSGELRPGVGFSEIIESTFPMGSMTGAPKKRVMELIEEFEASPRGIFSGSVGYIDPEGDFDFNVVIRSIMYNASNQYLSYQVGSGITVYSDPQKEWEECLLKGEAINRVLTS